MKSLDWQTSLPRLPDVGRVQQVGQGQGELVQEYLSRLARTREQRAPRIKESAESVPVRPEPVRDRERRRHPGGEGTPEGKRGEGGRQHRVGPGLDVTV